MARYSNFATAAMNVTFPTWFYSAWGISGLMPLIKSRLSPEQLRQGAQPDARPVAVGETDLRAILRNLTDSATAAAAEVLAPEQLAVGVSGGISVLIHGIRLILEVQRTFVCVRVALTGVDGAAGPGTGIMVGGVPIGEPAFVTEVMRALVAGDVSYIETTVTQLRDQPHAVHRRAASRR